MGVGSHIRPKGRERQRLDHHAAEASMVLVFQGSLVALLFAFYHSRRTQLHILWWRPTFLLQHFGRVLAASIRI